MSELWTYTPSDFLMFSARTYYRLFELYNSEIWPAQILALTFGVVILVCLFRARARQGQIISVLLAACWFWVAWAFHAQRYATINWVATYFAAGFVIEALLLIWTGLVRDQLRLRPTDHPVNLAGLGLFLFALFVQPLLGPLMGRPWLQVEFFGIAPDPMVTATLGILLLAANRSHWLLLLVPTLWCAISGTTLWTMGSPDALMMPLAALLVMVLALKKTLSPSARHLP
ncbi:DUF6064 family protein [Crenobacter cavernae]|uniref:MFS transporter permease n=1 Tax=Crenobacter cavernae TaxID=2290923 RepID=A0A345Y217_9NEIS|nr:DUF6064 family protein [Crenobacter cavernae]AXK37969.1 hypothetical protein DWG20_00155 [Crenobacter cavernae]